jgi:hypothetical protein
MSNELIDPDEIAIRSVTDTHGTVGINRADLLGWLQCGAHLSFALDVLHGVAK